MLDLHRFIQEALELIKSTQSACDLPWEKCEGILRRNIHTLRGNLAYFNLPSAHHLMELIEQSISLHLDKTLFCSRLEEIKLMIMGLTPHQELENLLEKFAHDLADEMNKKISFYFWCDPTLSEDTWAKVLPYFNHFISNSIIHGIESVEERVLAKKKAHGHISISIRKNESQVEISLRDDGRGIDWVKMNKFDSSITDEFSAIQKILMGKVSTLTEKNSFSGRGLGISSLQDRVSSLGGDLKIFNELNQSFEIRICLPLLNIHHAEQAS